MAVNLKAMNMTLMTLTMTWTTLTMTLMVYTMGFDHDHDFVELNNNLEEIDALTMALVTFMS